MRFRPPKPTGMTLNLAPMVDVMMCLIIFFLLASKLVDAEHRPLNLPYAQAAREVDRSDLPTRVVINVRADETDALRAEYVVQGWDGRRITDKTLAPEQIETYLAARVQALGERSRDLRCVIRADRDVAYGHVEIVLRACGATKISKIVFGAQTGEDQGGGA